LILEFAVVAFFKCVVEVCCGMSFSVILDLLIALARDRAAVFQRKLVRRVLKIRLLNQDSLKRLGIESKSGASFQAFLVCIQIDILNSR